MSTLVAAAEELAVLARDRAAAAERARRLDDELVARMRAAGLFRLLVPASAGGGEAHPAELVRAVEALAAGDGAAGWVLAVTATSGLLGAWLEPEHRDEVFSDPDAVAGGVFAPLGRAARGADGALTVSGRWPFCSGVDHCTWVLGGVLEPSTAEGAAPAVRLCLAPRADAIVHDTWSVAGLRATGSHDLELRDARIPLGRTGRIAADAPREAGPLYAFPLFGLLAAAIAAVGLGLAREALADVTTLAAAKTPTGSARPLAARADAQAQVARATAAVRSARTWLLDRVDAAWSEAQDGAIGLERRADLRLAASHAMAASTQAVDAAWELAGGSAIYERTPLERRFRDVHVATQHMLVARPTWELAGRALLGAGDVSQL